MLEYGGLCEDDLLQIRICSVRKLGLARLVVGGQQDGSRMGADRSMGAGPWPDGGRANAGWEQGEGRMGAG